MGGFILGLIPMHRLRDLAVSTFAKFRRNQVDADQPELDWSRPVLWAWVLPTTAFLIRFITWPSSQDKSVLGTLVVTGPSRWEHFFGTSAFAMSSNWLPWFYDRLFLTAPMLFLLAFPAAVWLRHHLPQHAAPQPAPSDPIPTDTLGS